MSAVSKRVMPASNAVATTSSAPTSASRRPKLLQPSPTRLPFSPESPSRFDAISGMRVCAPYDTLASMAKDVTEPAAKPRAGAAAAARKPAPRPHENHDRPVVTIRVLVSSALIVLGIVALVFFLSSIIGIVLAVLVAIVFAEGIRPLVHRLQARGVPQALGIVIVYVGIIAFFGLMITLL